MDQINNTVGNTNTPSVINVKEAVDIQSSMTTALVPTLFSYLIMVLFFFSIPKTVGLARRAEAVLTASGNAEGAAVAGKVFKFQNLKWKIFLGMIVVGFLAGIVNWFLPGRFILDIYGYLAALGLLYFVVADVVALINRGAVKKALSEIKVN